MIAADRPPYPGLRPFERSETDLFFGRDDAVDAMIARLEKARFLAVLGSSGTGKSSLVKTGLLSGLEMGLLAGSRWRIAEFRPGGDPLGRLAEGLLQSESAESSNARPSATAVQSLRARFKSEGPRELIKWCREGHLADGTNLLLLVDQFEEFFRYRNTEEREEAQAFVSLLLESRWPHDVASPQQAEVPIFVTITMRSEYLGACALMLGLAEAINEGTYLTPRMTREQCEEAIVGPALVCGVEIEERLVTRILNDMADFAPWEEQRDSKDQLSRLARQADQLPLMQYALNQMWWRAKNKREAKDDQEDAKIQLRLADYLGLERELDAHGDEVYNGLGESLKTTAQTVFRAVTTGSTPANAQRRPTQSGDLVKICGEGSRDLVEEVIEKFGPRNCQFLISDPPKADKAPLPDDAWIDISHESLIRQWGKLSGWLREEYQSAETYRDIERSAKQWKSRAGNLLTKLDLSNARRWRKTERPNAAWAERYGDAFGLAMEFLHESERYRYWRRGLVSAGIVAPLIVIAGAIWVMLYFITGIAYLNASEFSDYGVKPQSVLKQQVGTETPINILGGRVVDTLELRGALDSGNLRGAPFILIDALSGKHETIPKGVWIDEAGNGGNFHDAVQHRLAEKLNKLTGGDRDMSLVFYCKGSKCWESYNACLRAIRLGYSHVYWYRGGTDAWEQGKDTTVEQTTVLEHTVKELRERKLLSRISVKPRSVLLELPDISLLIMNEMFRFPITDQREQEEVKESDQYYRRGHDEVDKDPDDAIANFNKAIALNQENANYYYERGRAYVSKGDYEDAIEDFIYAVKLDPAKSTIPDHEYATAYNNRGDIYYDKKDYDDAVVAYSQAIRLNHEYSEAYKNRGDAYLNKKDYDPAIADYTQVITLKPEDAIAYRTRGIAYHQKEDYDDAIPDYTQAIALNPKDAIAYRTRGFAYYQKEDYDHAITDYTQAITLKPEDAIAYRARGLAYSNKSDFDRAIADYTQAVTLDPKYSVAYRNRGFAYQGKKDYDHAIADYTQAITLDPSDVRAYSDRGDAYHYRGDEGDNDLAIADYTQAVMLNPKDASAYRGRGWAHYVKGERDAAMDDYDHAIAIEQKDASAFFDRGLANLYAGRLSKALADIQQANELAPKWAYTAIWLDIVNKRSKLPSRLAETAKQIDMTRWPAPVVNLYLGKLTPAEVLSAADDPDSGTKNGQVCEAQFYTGELALQRGAKQEAVRFFRFAATNCPLDSAPVERAAAKAELMALSSTDRASASPAGRRGEQYR